MHAFARRYQNQKAGEDLLAQFITRWLQAPLPDGAAIWAAVLEERNAAALAGSPVTSESSSYASPLWERELAPYRSLGIDALVRLAHEGRLVLAAGAAMTEPGVASNSAHGELDINGKPTAEAARTVVQRLEQLGAGQGRVQYKLRDWLFSRQRYWGEPFPILHALDEHGNPTGEVRSVPESELPVVLPPMDDFRPESSDDPAAPVRTPLARAPESWRYVTRDGVRYEREMNTMPQWAGSCWYYLRFLDPSNSQRFVGQDAERYWMLSLKHNAHTPPNAAPREQAAHHFGGIDLYVGGAEHAVLHLLYSRFWHKVLFDLGHVSTPEPFGRLFNQGYIQAYAYTDARGVYVNADEVEERPDHETLLTRPEHDKRTDALTDRSYRTTYYHRGQPVVREFGKMGKSLRNAVAPDDICESHGADTLRLYEMYLGPLEQSKPWSTQDIVGVHRFLQRVWRSFVDEETSAWRVVDQPAEEALRRKLHRTIHRVTQAMESMSFNVAIAALIELNNELIGRPSLPSEVAHTMTLMLAPLAPHLAEELWQRLGHSPSVATQPWPSHDPALLIDALIELPVQVNGKLRARVSVPSDANDTIVQALVLEDAKVHAALAGQPLRKAIFIPGRLINLVTG
jgi:leucyl-tRNA synthetase